MLLKYEMDARMCASDRSWTYVQMEATVIAGMDMYLSDLVLLL